MCGATKGKMPNKFTKFLFVGHPGFFVGFKVDYDVINVFLCGDVSSAGQHQTTGEKQCQHHVGRTPVTVQNYTDQVFVLKKTSDLETKSEEQYSTKSEAKMTASVLKQDTKTQDKTSANFWGKPLFQSNKTTVNGDKLKCTYRVAQADQISLEDCTYSYNLRVFIFPLFFFFFFFSFSFSKTKTFQEKNALTLTCTQQVSSEGSLKLNHTLKNLNFPKLLSTRTRSLPFCCFCSLYEFIRYSTALSAMCMLKNTCIIK